MTLDTLLTVIAIILGVLAIIPSYRRKELFLKISIYDKLVIIVLLIFYFYLQFYDIALKLELNLNLGLYKKYGITTNKASFLALLLILIYLWFSLRKLKLNKRKLHKFSLYIEDLHKNKNTVEAISLINENFEKLNYYYSHISLLTKFKKRFQKKRFAFDRIDIIENIIIKILKPILTFFAELIPATNVNHNIFIIIKKILSKKNTVKIICDYNIPFALKVIHSDMDIKYKFSELFLKIILENNDSELYREIKNNQNILKSKYYIEKENRILYSLLKDARICDKIALVKTIGEFLLKEIEEMGYSKNRNIKFNRPIKNFDNFDVSNKWDLNIFIGIRFIDIVVIESLYQNIEHDAFYFTMNTL